MFEKYSAVNPTTDETDLTDNYQVIIAARQDISAIRVIRVQEKISRSIRQIRVPHRSIAPRFMPPLGWGIIESLTVLQHWIEKL